MSGWKKYSLILLAALAWFALFQPWGGFVDPDAFYHAKMASLMWRLGPLHAFPWLDLTTFGRTFADQHFLFHALLMPFVLLWGTLPGAQIAAVVMAAAFALAFYILLERWPVAHPGFWTVLALITAPLIFRLSLAKASPLALFWFVLGIYAVARRRPWLGLLVGFGFMLSHGGWIIVLAAQFLFLIGEWMFELIVENRSWSQSFDRRAWLTFFATIAGVAAGILVHPNSRTYLQFLWVQLVKIGLGTPFGRVFLGEEWLPSNLNNFFSSLAQLCMVGLVVVYGLLVARREPVDRTKARQSIGLGLVTAAMLALTIKSQRFIEYLVPAFTLWLALLASLVDERKLFFQAKALWSALTKRERIIAGLIALAVLLTFGRGAVGAYEALHRFSRPFDEYAKPMAAISASAKPGDRVFHSSWDQFPELFVLDDRLRYIVGLDPTFLLDADPDLSDAYTKLTFAHTTSATVGAYAIIHDRFHAKFVFLVKQDHQPFADAIAADHRFVQLYNDDKAAAYRVQ